MRCGRRLLRLVDAAEEQPRELDGSREAQRHLDGAAIANRYDLDALAGADENPAPLKCFRAELASREMPAAGSVSV